jgi:hypothetical protein
MLFAAVLIDAFHATLEDRKEPFNRVRVNGAASIFLCSMVDRIVRGEFFAVFFFFVTLCAVGYS